MSGSLWKAWRLTTRQTASWTGPRWASSSSSTSLVERLRESRVTYNDLPVPSGSWQEAYNKKKAGYNTRLALSFIVFVASMAALFQSGALYMHPAPDYKKLKFSSKTP